MNRAHPAMDLDIADEVVAFLHRHPAFLAENPELYRVLTPPVRVHGDALADHMAAMIRAERAHAAAMAARADVVLAAGRAAAGIAERVQEAVIALMGAEDPVDWVDSELPGLLGLDAATLCIETYRPGTRRIPVGTTERLLRGRDTVFRDHPADAYLLHAEAAPLARHDALVRIPGHAPALLALAARAPHLLRPDQGLAALTFLGRALGAALRLS